MPKKFIFALSFIMLGLTVTAQVSNRNSLTLDTTLGLLSGTAEEIVYMDNRASTLASELLWNFSPLVYAGIDLNLNLHIPNTRFNFIADVRSKFGFANGESIVEDRDWMYVDYPLVLSHYSVHDNETDSAILLDFDAGISFTVFNQFILKTFLSYSYMHFAWTAKGGAFLYPDVHGGHSLIWPPSTVVGTYEQTWNILSPGVSFYGDFNPFFGIELFLKISPIVWCSSIDNHILRDLVITDSMFGGIFMEPGFYFSFKPGDSVTLILYGSYRYNSGLRGDGVYDEIGKPVLVHENGAGSGFTASNFGIKARFSLNIF